MLDFLVGNDALLAIIAFGLVLIPAIFIHELGHYLAGKAVGITILEFGIGFPPRIMTLFTWRETEYTLNWLPIGGFVRPLGEDFVAPVNEAEVEKDRAELVERQERMDPLHNEREMLRARGIEKIKSVNEATPFQRIFFFAAGPIANLLTAIVVFSAIGVFSGLPTLLGGSAGVISVGAESALAAAGVQSGDIIEKVDGEYFESLESFLAIMDDEAGNEVTLQIQRGDDVFDVSYAVPTNQNEASAYILITAVSPESPAERNGLQPGDLITAMDGTSFAAYMDLPERTQEQLGEEITLTILRDGETLDANVTPRVNPPEGEGAIGIGIMPAYAVNGNVLGDGGLQRSLTTVPLGEAVGYSFSQIQFYVETLISLPANLINGVISPEQARPMSPLAIVQAGGIFLQESIEEDEPAVILNYIAIISIALGITNLLPIPALDGGRILFVIFEIVRGRPVAPEREGLVHLIGMALLLSLLILAFVNDIINPITNLLP